MKLLLRLLFLLLLPFFLSTKIYAQEQIKNFDTEITIDQNGTIKVEERIEYDLDDLNRHGIYRDIPYITTNKDGKKFKLELANFSVTDGNENRYKYEKSVVDGKIRLKIGDPDKTVTGIRIYKISYQVSGALTYFSDHDELYWNSTGNNWTVPIASYTSGVKLPNGISQNDISVVCYTGSAGSTEQNCKTSIEENSIEVTGVDPLASYEGMTFAVSFPKGHVEVSEAQPYVPFWQTIWGKTLLALIIFAAILWYIVYPIWIPIKWFQQGRDPKHTDVGEARAWFDPPKTNSGRSLTPEETGALVDERADMEDVSGMLIYLAQKGHLKIEERKKKDFYLVRRIPPTAGKGELLDFEKIFIDKIFEGGAEFHIKKHKLYTEVEKAKTSIYERLVKEGFFTQNPNKIRTFYSVIGVLALATGSIPLAFSAFFFGRHMPRKTMHGVETANIARSLKNFLSSQERRLEFLVKKSDLPVDRQVLFEKLLPYAVVFGVEKIWAQRFADIAMKPPDWYSGYSTVKFNSVSFANSLNSSFLSVRSAATPVTSTTGHGSGFSGGSSGGGGGGGGGGSW